MSRMTAEPQAPQYRHPADEWRGRPNYPEPGYSGGGLPSSLLLTGLVVVGLGTLAWYYLGPDVVRYMKIRNM